MGVCCSEGAVGSDRPPITSRVRRRGAASESLRGALSVYGCTTQLSHV